MPRKPTHPPYPPEFRRRMVELVHAGRGPEELAREFEPSAQTIRNWVAQTKRDAGTRADGLTTGEKEELRRLRRENAVLREVGGGHSPPGRINPNRQRGRGKRDQPRPIEDLGSQQQKKNQ